MAVKLLRRASRVRRLMGGMVSKDDYDRLQTYAEKLEIQAARLEQTAPKDDC